MSNGGAKKRWDPAVKSRALELAADVGPGRASQVLDVPENTIKSWQTRESRKAHAELARANLVMPVRTGLSWAAHRAQLLPAMAELATEALAASRLCVQEGRAKAASDFASVAARMVDRASVLGGDVTSRSESRSLSLHADVEETRKLQAEIAELERELAGG